MRKVFSIQPQLGQINISDIPLDSTSRDDIPQILRGLQHIYSIPEKRKAVFSYLTRLIPEDTNWNNGRPGMDLWAIFVLASLRVNLDCDYDRVAELANEHKTLRLMLGHEGPFTKASRYSHQTLKNNLSLLTPEILEEINQEVVKAGHEVLGLSGKALKGRADSFVVKTDVEYPTDVGLLEDALRKVIYGCAWVSKKHGVKGWRQSRSNYQAIKNLCLRAQRMKRSTSEKPEQKAAREEKIQQAHTALIEKAKSYLERAQTTLKRLGNQAANDALCAEIEYYRFLAHHQIDLIRRRVLEKETIPHQEKIFSLFEPHTEWVSKGKAGVAVELGLRMCILEDQAGFILHTQVMPHQTDEKVAVEIVREAKKRFPSLTQCSFDKGFWKLENREELGKIIELPVLPKKGKLSKKDKEIEEQPEFVQARKKHSAVESAINALQVHGLDMCPDHGLDGLKRYVMVGMVGRNLQKLGAILLDKERKSQARQKRLAA